MGNVGGNGRTGRKDIMRRKKWDNCNSITNKIYFKKKKEKSQAGKKKKIRLERTLPSA